MPLFVFLLAGSNGLLARTQLDLTDCSSTPLLMADFQQVGSIDLAAEPPSCRLARANATHIVLCGHDMTTSRPTWQVWDTVYSTLQHAGPVAPDLDAGERCSALLRLSASCMVVALSSTVLSVPVTIRTASLAAALGKASLTASVLAEHRRSALNTPALAHPATWQPALAATENTWPKELRQQDARLQLLANALIDEQTTPTLELFTKAWVDYDAAVPGAMAAHVVPALVARILGEKRFFAEQPLLGLIRTKLVSLKCVDRFFSSNPFICRRVSR